jgi:SAM-dependent MidA family methyltransferase
LGYLKQQEPRFYEHLHYHMVERSPVVSERQKGLLASHEGKVLWYESGETGRLKVTGCFLSNELVDSFPVHRVVMEGGALQEVFVDLNGGAFTEVRGEPSTPELPAYFRRVGITLAEGQHAEVNLEALRWLHAVAQGLTQGFVITIDYGYQAQELYAPSRPAGTFMCYQRHRALSDPYGNLGQQDMTSHVDFTALILCGEKEGLHCTGLIPQYRFLLALGILEEAARMGQGKGEGETLHERLTIKNLILQGAMGETFKCLIQHKGIRSPQLEGLREIRGGESWLVRRSSAL